MQSSSAGGRLREAWRGGALMVPGVFNALAARMAQQAGFSAVYLSGAALSAGLAMPDVGLVTLPEFVEAVRSLVRAVDVPVISDADTGFGEVVNVERTVREFEAAGVAAMHLEDQRLPKRCGHLGGKELVEPGEMVEKIRAAVEARRDAGFVIIARTDARAVTGFDDALARAQSYVEAGADMIFPEALESAEEFERFADALEAPLLANMTEFGKSPLLPFSELADMGYSIVLYPVTLLRVAMGAVAHAIEEIKNLGTQQGLLDQMQTRQELYELLQYNPAKET